MRWKVKCASENDYKKLKKVLREDGVAFSRKEGKSLKVDCNKDELLSYLAELRITPISIKPGKDTKVVVGYRAHNNFDGQGLVEDYDFVGSINEMLPVVHCADDARELSAFLHGMGPVAREVFLHSNRRFVEDNRDYEGSPSYPSGVDWRYERGGVFCDDDYEM